MIDSFERLTGGISTVYKKIQKIKKLSMNELGLKGVHVMCIYYLYTNSEGLTASELCDKCREDKAGISRILADLERSGMIQYHSPAQEGRRYRAKAILTDKGHAYGSQVNDLIRAAAEAGGSGLTQADIEIFYRVLHHISDNLEELLMNLEAKGREDHA